MTSAAPDGVLPARVGVVGGGRMGSGIAHAFLCGGSSVTVVEADEAAAAGARRSVADAVQTSIDRGTLSAGLDPTVARLDVSASFDALAGCDLVVEAVPEDLALKHDVLARITGVLHADSETVLGSNTSSFSISGLAEHAPDPGRFLGLHFFNPVPRSELVEVVLGDHTAAEVSTRAQEWVGALGKTAITLADSPGFATSRLGLALGLEAIRMVEDGVASPADIDTAMTLGYRHPVGPLRLTDLVGLDVRLGVADYLAAELGERFAAPRLLRDKVAAGELGRKTGKGFHDW